MTIHMTLNETDIVAKILRRYLQANTKVWVFGSRAQVKIKKHSDLDLAIDQDNQPLNLSTLANLQEAFSESPLPYKVDLIDLNNISDDFKQLIKAQAKPLLY